MANWTPEERNDGSVILGWYSAGTADDAANHLGIVNGGLSVGTWYDRTPYGNDLVAGANPVPWDDNSYCLRIASGGEYLFHSSPYVLGSDDPLESITYFVVVDMNGTTDAGRYFISEGGSTDKSTFIPIHAGDPLQGTTADTICATVRGKDGNYRIQQQPVSDLTFNSGKQVIAVTYSVGKGYTINNWVGGSVTGQPGTVDTQYTISHAWGSTNVENEGRGMWADPSLWKGTGDKFLVNGVSTDAGITGQTSPYDLYEILIVRNCSKNLRQLIEGYLANKHGIRNQLPATHPGFDAPVQTGPETDPYYSLVRAYNQFKGPVGQQWSQDLKAPIGLRMTFNENDPPIRWDPGVDKPWQTQYQGTEEYVYWWTSGITNPPDGAEWNELPGITLSTGEPLSPNNPNFPYWFGGKYWDDSHKGLAPRPLKSGSTAFWAGFNPERVELEGTTEILRNFDTILHSQNSGLEDMGQNDFTIEFSFMPVTNRTNLIYGDQHTIFRFGNIRFVAMDRQQTTDAGGTNDQGVLRLFMNVENQEIQLLANPNTYGESNYITDENDVNWGFGIESFTYKVPAGEELYRAYEVCIQRTQGRLDLWLDGELVNSGFKPIDPGNAEIVEVNYTSTARWETDTKSSGLPSWAYDKRTADGTDVPDVLLDGLGFCFESRADIPGNYPTGGGSIGFAVIDDFRYTLGVARYDVSSRYHPALQVNPPEQPSIINEPEDVYCYEGDTAIFVCQATSLDGTITYQWYNGDGTVIAGANSGTLTLFTVPFVYPYRTVYCLVDNGLAKNRSRTASLFCNPDVIPGIMRVPGLPSAPKGIASNPQVIGADIPGPLGAPTGSQLQTIVATGPLPSPLYPPRVVVTLDLGDKIDKGSEYYGAVLIDSVGNETVVKISSYQATLSARSQNYAQIVIPAASEYSNAINTAIAFRVSKYVKGPNGEDVVFVMAAVGTLTRTFQRGPQSNTCTIRGYSERFAQEEGQGTPLELRGVRSYSTGETGTRVRANLDELVKPGRRVQYEEEQDFVVGFVNQYVTGNEAYMDVGE